MKLTDEQIRMLAECERQMDAGTIPYVIFHGQRCSMSSEAMSYFGLVVGQSINDEIFKASLEYNISLLQEKIAEKCTDEMMEKITKKND